MKNLIIGILIIIVLVLLGRYVIFKDRFEQWSEGMARIEKWEADYRVQHPGASKEEVQTAFNAGISNMKSWKDQYLKEHPGATEAEATAALDSLWNKVKEKSK